MQQRGSGWAVAIILLVIAALIAAVVYWWLRGSGYHGATGPSTNYVPNVVPGAMAGAGVAPPPSAGAAGQPPITPAVPAR